MRHPSMPCERHAGWLLCLMMLIASGCASRPVSGTSLLLRPHGQTAEDMRKHLASSAAARGFVLVDAVPADSSGCYVLDYSCDLLPSGKRQPPRAAVDATLTDARSGSIRYRDRIVSSSPNGVDAAASTAEETLLEGISRAR